MSRLATAGEPAQMRVRSVSLARPMGANPRLGSTAQQDEATASLFARPRRRVATVAAASVAVAEEATPGPPVSLSRQASCSDKPMPPRVHPDVAAAYSFESVLGAGAFGTVWACKQRSTGALAALKIVDRTSQADGDFQLEPAEAEILKRVSHHPNIVKLLDYFASDSCVYLAMELVDGGNVQDRLDEVGRFSEQEGASIFKQVVSAVHHLHDQSITHRDIKPDNLLFAYKGNSSVVKLTDFGLSTMKEGRLTAKCGTPSYCAPELLSDAGYGRAVDLWALGVLAYVLIVGELPFRGKDRGALFKRIQAGRYSYPPACDLGHLAKDIISRLLRMTPMDRYSTRETLQHPWVAAVDGDGEVYRQEGGGARRRSRDLDTVLEMMRRFNAQERWRRAAVAVFALATFRAAGARRARRLRAEERALIAPSGSERGGAASCSGSERRGSERSEDRATTSDGRRSNSGSEEGEAQPSAARLSSVRKRLLRAGVSIASIEISDGSPDKGRSLRGHYAGSEVSDMSPDTRRSASRRGQYAPSERSEGSATPLPRRRPWVAEATIDIAEAVDLAEDSVEKRRSLPASRPLPMEAAASATSVPFMRRPPATSASRQTAPQLASGASGQPPPGPRKSLVPAPPARQPSHPMPSPQPTCAADLYAQSLQQSSVSSPAGFRSPLVRCQSHERVPAPAGRSLDDRLTSDDSGQGAVWAAHWREGAAPTPDTPASASHLDRPPSDAERRTLPLYSSSAFGDSPARGHAAMAATPLRRVGASPVLRPPPAMLDRSDSVLSRAASGAGLLRPSAMAGTSSSSGLGSVVPSLAASRSASPALPGTERSPPARRQSYPNMETFSLGGPNRSVKMSASGLLGPGSAALLRAQKVAAAGPTLRRSLDSSYHREAAHAAHTVQAVAAAAVKAAAAHVLTPAQLADAAIARAADALDQAAWQSPDPETQPFMRPASGSHPPPVMSGVREDSSLHASRPSSGNLASVS